MIDDEMVAELIKTSLQDAGLTFVSGTYGYPGNADIFEFAIVFEKPDGETIKIKLERE